MRLEGMRNWEWATLLGERYGRGSERRRASPAHTAAPHARQAQRVRRGYGSLEPCKNPYTLGGRRSERRRRRRRAGDTRGRIATTRPRLAACTADGEGEGASGCAGRRPSVGSLVSCAAGCCPISAGATLRLAAHTRQNTTIYSRLALSNHTSTPRPPSPPSAALPPSTRPARPPPPPPRRSCPPRPGWPRPCRAPACM